MNNPNVHQLPLGKEDVVCTCGGILLSNEKERSVNSFYNMGELQKQDSAQPQRPRVIESTYVKYPGEVNEERQEGECWLPVAGGLVTANRNEVSLQGGQ